MPNLREIWNFKPENHLHWRMLNSSIANFLQYCYSAILNIELHYSKYCKKNIYIFYLTLSPLFCLSSLTLSPLSLISRLCLYRRTQQLQPSTTEHSPRIRNPRICNPRPMIHNWSSASMSSSWSDWSFGFYWSRVLKFRIFLFVGFVDWCVFGWSMKFWVLELMRYCWILFEWFLGFLNLFNGLFLEPRRKWRLQRKLQIEI